MKLLLSLLVFIILPMPAAAQWVKQSVGSSSSLRGLSVISEKVAWASGTRGTVIRTVDGGKTWSVIIVPGAEKLDFRDIESFDADTAYILSIGNGDSSRIYKTSDGGKSWKLEFTNTNEKAFYDAIACWDRTSCIAMSDPVDGRYLLISTNDGGANWKPLTGGQLPSAKEGEAAFAASGTCLITQGTRNAFLVSGGSDARVFRSTDRGRNWAAAETPIARGTPGSGIFSIAMRNSRSGTIVGGNYEKPDDVDSNLAFTADGGATWKAGSGLSGYRSGVAFIDDRSIVAVGTNGSDISLDGGRTWKNLDKENYNAVQSKGRNAVWAVGPKGRVANLAPIPNKK